MILFKITVAGKVHVARYDVSGRHLVIESHFGRARVVLGLCDADRLARQLLKNLIARRMADGESPPGKIRRKTRALPAGVAIPPPEVIAAVVGPTDDPAFERTIPAPL